MKGISAFGRSRAARQLETVVLIIATLLCATLLGFVSPCLLLTIQDLGEPIDQEICIIRGSWIGSTLFVGALGCIPSGILLRERLRARANNDQRRSQMARSSPTGEYGYVRPSIYKQFRPSVNPYTCARRVLRVAQFLSSSCAATLDLVLAVVLIAVYPDSLVPAATIVLCSTCVGYVLVHRVVPRIMQVDRLTCALTLVVIERACALLALGMIFLLTRDAFPGALVNLHQEGIIVQNSKHSRSKGAADRSTPLPSASDSTLPPEPTMAPTFLPTPDPPAPTSSRLDLGKSGANPWIFEEGSHDAEDPALDATLTGSHPQLLHGSPLLWFAILVTCISLSIVARSARSSLIRKDWSRLVASAPFSMTHAVTHEEGYYDQQTHAKSTFAKNQASSLLSPLGSLTPSEDEGDDFASSEEGQSQTQDHVDFEPELVYGAAGTDSIMARDTIDASVVALKVHLSRVHTAAYVSSPILFGLVLDLGNPQQALFIALETAIFWQILCGILETSCFRLAYHTETALRTERPPLDTSVTFFDPYDSRSIYHPIGVAPRQPRLEKLKRWLKRWRIYIQSPVFLASLSYAVLNLSVLDLGLLSLTYLRWRRLPVWIIGLLLGLRCFSCGLVTFVKYIHRWTGSLARTASLTTWVLWSTSFPALLGFVLFSSTSKASVLFLMVVLVLSGPPLRAFALVHAKLLREWVEEEHVSTILNCQLTVRTSCTVLITLVALCLGEASMYGVLVIISVLSSFLSVILFALWFRVFDSGTPFQVVDHTGHVKVIVHG